MVGKDETGTSMVLIVVFSRSVKIEFHEERSMNDDDVSGFCDDIKTPFYP